MQRATIHRLLVGVIGATFILPTLGAASVSASTAAYETRGAFIEHIDQKLGISPVYPSTPTFQDVPSTNPYYGYIEAAFEKGYINGISPTRFGPGDPLTRAQAAKILVEAYGSGAAAQSIHSTKFADNAKIPTALVGFVGEAAALGLMNGFPNGDFSPMQYLTQAQMVDLIAHLLGVLAGANRPTLQLVPPASTTFSEDNGKTGITYGVQVVDHGTAATLPANTSLMIIVLNSQGMVAQNIKVNGSSQYIPHGYPQQGGFLEMNAGSGSFTLTDDQSGPDAGNYTVEVQDPTGAYASAKGTFTETAGALAVVSATNPAMLYQKELPAAIDLENGVASTASPGRTVTAQLSDAWGNPIAQSGVPINFDASGGCSTTTPTLSSPQGGTLTQGSSGGKSGPVLKLQSDAQGQATATITGAAVAGDYYCISLWSPNTPDTNGAATNINNTLVGFSIASSLATQLQVQFTDSTPTSPDYLSHTQAVAGDQVGMTITARDQNGNPTDGYDIVKIALPVPQALDFTANIASSAWPKWLTVFDNAIYVALDSQGTRVIPSSYFTVDGGPGSITTSSLTVTLSDISLQQPVTSTATLGVQPGAENGLWMFDPSGHLAYDNYPIPANAPTALDVVPTDNYVHATPASANYVINMYAGAGHYSMTPDGTPLDNLSVPSGSSSVQVYYTSPNPLMTDELGWTAWVSYPTGSSLTLQPGQSITFTGDDFTSGGSSAPTWAFSGTHAGTLSAPTDNGLQVTYTAPSSGQGTDQITYTDPTGGAITFSVSY